MPIGVPRGEVVVRLTLGTPGSGVNWRISEYRGLRIE